MCAKGRSGASTRSAGPGDVPRRRRGIDDIHQDLQGSGKAPGRSCDIWLPIILRVQGG